MKKLVSRRGFTLVEIIIVVAVLAVLAGIAFPVFVRVRERGRCATCQDNLRQIALAMQQYVADSSGRYPAMRSGSGVLWNDAVMPYVKERGIFRCPSRQSPLIENPSTDYAYNYTTLNTIPFWDSNANNGPFGNTQFNGAHEASIAISPSRVFLNYEGGGSTGDGGPDTAVVETPWGTTEWMTALHSGGANFSYIDGHVKWRSKEEQLSAG